MIPPALLDFLRINFGWHGLTDWRDGDLRW